ncbi:biotin/acetyl-CoA-carboxylase ligase [Thermosphaera aggregans DSM 11486]|uniref:Biotin/acetyl-CoA-carboxylase ligase n=2 Tax=Thermosphaera aggregans TaxID=54254 RepID=D5U0I2_THEAM|nr:biotin/acetyl-CoA-carboxylase ligase [Thermosphaera aggregans DSM 11486]
MGREGEEFSLLLELLKLLSESEKITPTIAERELGLTREEYETLVSVLKKYFMLREEKDTVILYRGDNLKALHPWGWNYVYRIIVGSTMNMARKFPPWSVVIAEYQVYGKGRHGKTWIGSLGGLWVTYKIRLQAHLAQFLPIAVPVLLTRILGEQFKMNALIKWPNDIVVKDKKLAGILVEAEASGSDMMGYIGLGVNINNDPPLETATSLKELIGSLVPRNRVCSKLTGWISRIDKLVEKPELLRLEYLEKLSTLGKRVRIMVKDGEIVGNATSISELGELIVETASGSVKVSSSEALKVIHLD